MGVAAVLALTLSACSSAKQPETAASSGPVGHDRLRIAFRASFLNACEKGVAGAQGLKYCTCIDDTLEASTADSELAKLTPENPKVRATMHECASQAGLRLKPGH